MIDIFHEKLLLNSKNMYVSTFCFQWVTKSKLPHKKQMSRVLYKYKFVPYSPPLSHTYLPTTNEKGLLVNTKYLPQSSIYILCTEFGKYILVGLL